jgi:hypothetical protein
MCVLVGLSKADASLSNRPGALQPGNIVLEHARDGEHDVPSAIWRRGRYFAMCGFLLNVEYESILTRFSGY